MANLVREILTIFFPFSCQGSMKEENSGTADDDKSGVTHLPSEEEASSQTAKDKEETRKTESGTGKFETHQTGNGCPSYVPPVKLCNPTQPDLNRK